MYEPNSYYSLNEKYQGLGTYPIFVNTLHIEVFGSRLPAYNRAKCGKDSRSVSRLQRSASWPHSFAMGLAIPYDDYVSKAKPWYEVLRKVAFSPFGLFVLNAAYAILGDLYMIYLSVMTHDS